MKFNSKDLASWINDESLTPRDLSSFLKVLESLGAIECIGLAPSSGRKGARAKEYITTDLEAECIILDLKALSEGYNEYIDLQISNFEASNFEEEIKKQKRDKPILQDNKPSNWNSMTLEEKEAWIALNSLDTLNSGLGDMYASKNS